MEIIKNSYDDGSFLASETMREIKKAKDEIVDYVNKCFELSGIYGIERQVEHREKLVHEIRCNAITNDYIKILRYNAIELKAMVSENNSVEQNNILFEVAAYMETIANKFTAYSNAVEELINSLRTDGGIS